MLGSMKFGHKLRLLGVSVLACASIALLYVGWQNERSMFRQKVERTRDVVEAAVSLVEHHVQDVRDGKATQEDAQAAALAELQAMRYDGKEYYWVNDMTPRMLMHPMKPELNGMAANAAYVPTKTKNGAAVKRSLSAWAGTISSFWRSLRISANGWSTPCHPVRM